MKSDEIHDRITATTKEIGSKQQRLAMIPGEKRALLAAGTVDEKKLRTLETEEATLPGEIDRLQRRLPLLQDEHEAVLSAEAATRQTALKEQWGVSQHVNNETGGLRK